MKGTISGLLAAFAVILWTGGDTVHAQTFIDQAKKHIVASKYEEAIKTLLEGRPEAQRQQAVAAVDNLIGWSYFSLGKLPEAENFLTSSFVNAKLENNTKVKQLAANNLGVLYFIEGDLDKSLSYFTQPYTRNTVIATEYRKLITQKRLAIEVEGNVQAGIAARADLKFDEAIQSYNKALELSPNDARLLEFKGYALYRLGKFDEAMNVMQMAYKADTTRIRKFLPLNIIKNYCASGREDEIAHFIKSAGLSSTTLQFWWERDGEFQSVCAKSLVVSEAMQR